jgi:phosphate transport system protein
MASGQHILKQYDVDLEKIRSLVLEMGGLAESQLKTALDAFERADMALADSVIEADRRVNELQVSIDSMVNHVIARRQPTAGDLRLIMGVAKAVTDIERIGDEAAKIARAARWVHEKAHRSRLNRIPDIRSGGESAARMLGLALDAFARLDPAAAAQIIRADEGIDERFRAILRQLVTFMMEDPRTISAAIDTVWAAKAIERIGDHAKNIAEHVIFIAAGLDVRHVSPDEIDRAVAQS